MGDCYWVWGEPTTNPTQLTTNSAFAPVFCGYQTWDQYLWWRFFFPWLIERLFRGCRDAKNQPRSIMKFSRISSRDKTHENFTWAQQLCGVFTQWEMNRDYLLKDLFEAIYCLLDFGESKQNFQLNYSNSCFTLRGISQFGGIGIWFLLFGKIWSKPEYIQECGF